MRVRVRAGRGTMRSNITLVLAAALAIVAAACGGGTERASSPQGGDKPKQSAKKITLTETNLGIPRWTLNADRIASYAEQTVFAENVHVDFFDEQGKPLSVLTSKQGRVDPSNDMTAIGDVLVRNTEGYTLETDSLRWMNTERLVRTDAFVKLTRGEDVLTGYGLVSDPGLKHFEIQQKVSGRSERGEGPVEGR